MASGVDTHTHTHSILWRNESDFKKPGMRPCTPGLKILVPAGIANTFLLTSKKGKPLYCSKSVWSQSVRYREILLYAYVLLCFLSDKFLFTRFSKNTILAYAVPDF